ncbi:hypothetical protein CBR_g50727 [Chara braunii]|uniref:Uncharacterized protein n=1 Tax=Chara braunii TaxID=69332 RepID=A0A388K5S6_CHABU|nr:hypothetical protein CBR_g50727 [Chara braunii]|eukprot:GBG65366.1 hypothetical protein CBR_g50727 [Chara braunii]
MAGRVDKSARKGVRAAASANLAAMTFLFCLAATCLVAVLLLSSGPSPAEAQSCRRMELMVDCKRFRRVRSKAMCYRECLRRQGQKTFPPFGKCCSVARYISQPRKWISGRVCCVVRFVRPVARRGSIRACTCPRRG